MDDWQTQNKSVGMHSTSSKHWHASCGNLWQTYDLWQSWEFL